jgi:TonB family protein
MVRLWAGGEVRHGGLADSRARLLSAMVAICAGWPLLAAEPVKPDAPVLQQLPLELPEESELKLTKFVYAQYPQLARRHGVRGIVVLQFTVLPDGSTTDIEVVSSEPASLAALFEESAVRAAQQWRYEPVIRNGEPVELSTTVRIRFEP